MPYRFQKWRDAIGVAPSEKALRDVIVDYVSTIDPHVMNLLPPECQSALRDARNVQEAAVTLLHAEMTYRGDAELGKLLHEIAHTFASGSVRLSKLRADPLVSARSE